MVEPIWPAILLITRRSVRFKWMSRIVFPEFVSVDGSRLNTISASEGSLGFSGFFTQPSLHPSKSGVMFGGEYQ